MNGSKESVFSVTEITHKIKTILEGSFGVVRVEGELSNVRPSSTGHLYFTLKDDNAVLSAVMFRGRLNGLSFQPADGTLVVVTGSIGVYEKRGSYQIICEKMEKAGEGNILAMLEERKKRLAQEGLFDSSRKKPLPTFPSKIAVVTSPTGAAIKDILRVLRRRNAGLNLVILPAPVQGEGAGEKIAAQIRRANMFGLGEVLIIGRGGGSLEDLLPFSDEDVVRAVAESEIPVISAVGHEIDVSLSDLAADLRAPTPSAAAEMVSASREELLSRILEMKQKLITTLEQRTERIRLMLRQFTPEHLERSFASVLQPLMLRLDDCKEDLLRGMQYVINEYRHTLILMSQKLEGSSPYAILGKGYALVEDSETNTLITDATMTSAGKKIKVQFAKNSLQAQVTGEKNERV